MAKNIAVSRMEQRVPMTVAVHLSGHQERPGVETTFTENVSPRGARVISSRRWRPNDRLAISSLPRDFRSTARVCYCELLRGEGFAVGIEFLESVGQWVFTMTYGSGNNLHG